MDFESAVEYLKSFQSFEDKELRRVDYYRFGLGRVRCFLRDYEVDYHKTKFVHVAGSKGKGSVSTMVAEYLSAMGRKTGLFTSPYFIDVTESFWVDGVTISKKEFVLMVEDLKKYIDGVGECALTYFELLTVLVLKYFSEKKVKYAVMEVGLGGRKDPTNVIHPEVAVLCRVENEHAAILGDSVGEILGEKMGIIKEGVSVVVGHQSEEVLRLVKRRLVTWEWPVVYVDGAVSGVGGGQVQRENAAVARAVLRMILGDLDLEFFGNVMKGLKLVGRFDARKIKGKTVVFDMAHTVASMQNLVDTLGGEFEGRELVFLLSFMKDKDVEAMVNIVEEVAGKVVYVNSHEERGVDYGIDGLEAFNKELKELKKDQVLVVTGSHFLVGKILKNLL